MTPSQEPASDSAMSNGAVNGHASISTNGVHKTASANGSSEERHEEKQYLNMIADIMARGQVRVSLLPDVLTLCP